MNKVVADKSPAVQSLTNDLTIEGEEIIDLGQYWRTIKRAKWSIMLVTLFCLIIGGLIASKAVPMYRASAKILADPQQPNANRNEQYIASALVFLYYETQYEIINSRNIAETVVDKLGLVEKYKKAQKENKNQQTSGLSSLIKEIKTEFSALFAKEETTKK